MRIDCALLCDAVTARDGLLYVLGGGITRLYRQQYPAPLGLAMGLRIMLHPTEAENHHNLEARLIMEDGAEIGRFAIEFGVENPGAGRPGEEVSVVIPVPLHQIALPKDGAYSFEVLIDGIHQVSVPFFSEAPGVKKG